MFGFQDVKQVTSDLIPSGYFYFVGTFNKQTRMYYRRYLRRKK